jgi:two-component system, LytTR family, response regulator
MSQINTIIIDDEKDSLELLQLLLAKHCPQVHLLATFQDPIQAMGHLAEYEPDLIFSDIEMPGMTGIELMQKARPEGAHVVFVTAFNDYAVRAFRANALDFLTKPVQAAELVEVVNKVSSQIKRQLQEQLESAQRSISERKIDRIAIASQQEITFIGIDQLVLAEAKNSYAELLLADGKKVLMTKSLKDLEDITNPDQFVRVHRHFLVNINYVHSFNRHDSVLILNNQLQVPVSRPKREELFGRFHWL